MTRANTKDAWKLPPNKVEGRDCAGAMELNSSKGTEYKSVGDFAGIFIFLFWPLMQNIVLAILTRRKN
ncbi:hypothetical protein NBRC116492_19910 [Aurantivibrio infirmus]